MIIIIYKFNPNIHQGFMIVSFDERWDENKRYIPVKAISSSHYYYMSRYYKKDTYCEIP